MKEFKTPAERLIIAVDLKADPLHPKPFEELEEAVMTIARKLADTGVYIKLNTDLRALGYGFIAKIHGLGLKVFADLKLFDIPNTVANDGEMLTLAKADMVTVACSTCVKGMKALKEKLPNAEVLGVTVLTSQTLEDVTRMNGVTDTSNAVVMFARMADEAGLDGLICSPKEIGAIRLNVRPSMTINTPGIRMAGKKIVGDDQNKDRTSTIAEAIHSGVDRVVIGRPITGEEDPRDATLRAIDEIAAALDGLKQH